MTHEVYFCELSQVGRVFRPTCHIMDHFRDYQCLFVMSTNVVALFRQFVWSQAFLNKDYLLTYL